VRKLGYSAVFFLCDPDMPVGGEVFVSYDLRCGATSASVVPEEPFAAFLPLFFFRCVRFWCCFDAQCEKEVRRIRSLSVSSCCRRLGAVFPVFGGGGVEAAADQICGYISLLILCSLRESRRRRIFPHRRTAPPLNPSHPAPTFPMEQPPSESAPSPPPWHNKESTPQKPQPT